MKLSQATREQKLKAAAELDGWELRGESWYHPLWGYVTISGHGVPSYDTSYDAIIPLIQNQTKEQREKFLDTAYTLFSETDESVLELTPSKLLDALLIATGKFEL